MTRPVWRSSYRYVGRPIAGDDDATNEGTVLVHTVRRYRLQGKLTSRSRSKF